MAALIDILKKAGFRGQALKMAYAIAMAESGGNAYAHNPTPPDNSYGLFQINMLGGMGPERRRQYGLSSNDDLFDPLVNAKIAYKMSGGGKNWKPWSTYLYGNYKQYYGGSMGAQVTNYSGASGAGDSYAVGTGTVTPKMDKYAMAESYGLTWATINANKELKSLFDKAVKGGWDATLFTAKLKNTKWWKTTSDSARKFFLMRTGDPATYKQKVKQYQFSINKMAVDVGLNDQLTKGTPSSLLNRVIQYKMRDGWSDARIKAYLGQYVTVHGGGAGQMYGEAGEAYDQIFQLAYLNGQTYSRKWYQDNIRKVMSGKSTVEALTASIRQSAASKYYAFANQIRAGQNVMDLAQPYIQRVAEILELPSTDIDLNNPFINKAMTSKVASGQKPGTQYSLWQFENDLRSDPLWKKTNNARESMFSVAHQVAKDFGMAF